MFKLLRKKKVFIRPLTIGTETYKDREYVLITLNGETVSELSPLKGLHTESLEQAFSQLKTLLPILEKDILHNGKTLRPKNLKSTYLFFGTLHDHFEKIEKAGIKINQLFPSVVFSIECMILNLVDKKEYPLLPICQLDFHEKVDNKPFNEAPCIKIKIGRDAIESEQKRIHDYLKIKGVQLRLDGNNLFLYDDLIKFLEDIPIENIQYIEDPFLNKNELNKYNREFLKGNLPPISLDNIINPEFVSLECIQFATLKPNLIGGISKSNQMANAFKKHHIKSVISSSFETEVGINNLNKMHLQFPGTYFQPPGLDTIRYFSPNEEDRDR